MNGYREPFTKNNVVVNSRHLENPLCADAGIFEGSVLAIVTEISSLLLKIQLQWTQ